MSQSSTSPTSSTCGCIGKGDAITIVRGDDTDAFGLRTITINLSGDLDLTNATATFTLVGYSKSWTNAETKTGKLTMALSGSDTAKFPLGNVFGVLRLFDGTKQLTVVNKIPFCVTNSVQGIPSSEYDIHVTLAVDTELDINVSIAASLWEIDASVVKPRSDTVQRVVVPALANVAAVGSRYTLADVKNLVNTILAALKE